MGDAFRPPYRGCRYSLWLLFDVEGTQLFADDMISVADTFIEDTKWDITSFSDNHRCVVTLLVESILLNLLHLHIRCYIFVSYYIPSSVVAPNPEPRTR